MQKNLAPNLFHFILITFVFLVVVLIFRRDTLSFRFDPNLIDRYYHSQDITHEVSDRIFLSDGDVYIATGYLYAMGSDPSINNFEHPPVIKYLFGFSTRIFGNPLIVQILLGFLMAQLVYLVGSMVTKDNHIGLAASVLIMIDPLFVDTLGQPLLDLGQTVFMLGYFYLIFYDRGNWLGQGILLALFAGCKFWITPAFFVTLITFYKWYKHELDRNYFLHLIASIFVYATFYLQSFLHQGLGFNLIWHMLRTLKYRLVHNTSAFFGASVLLYTTGYWKSWWDSSGFIRSTTWTILWPASLLVSVKESYDSLSLKKFSLHGLVAITPILYLIFLGVQAPFPRYFLIFLPFTYIALAKGLFDFINRHKVIVK